LKSIGFNCLCIPTKTTTKPFKELHHHKPQPSQKGGLIMLNSVVLAGNLGNDPDIHFNSEGEPIASFNLAFDQVKKTGWIKVRLQPSWRSARSICTALKSLPRSLDHSQWETNEGVKRSAIQMIANSIEFIKTDGRGFTEGQAPGEETPF
jgi:single-strand DNA-binding protein